MKPNCPYCRASDNSPTDSGSTRIYAKGTYRRRSDRRPIKRYYCAKCRRGFSGATPDPFFRSRTRPMNQQVYDLLSSNVSQRRIARLLRISRGTVQRKLIILGSLCEQRQAEENMREGPANHVQFDDLETFEHTKMKPLSGTCAVTDRRIILAFVISRMAASGPFAEKSRKKYGVRKDERFEGRRKLFDTLQPLVSPKAMFRTDQNPYYVADLKEAFPLATHEATKGRLPREQGQGELKYGAFDPLFSINHTLASFRANVNRLIRKTWCTTKKAERLTLHMHIYADYHNQFIRTNRPPNYPHFKPERRPAKNVGLVRAQLTRPV